MVDMQRNKINMNIVVFLGHPAHYHFFKNIIPVLEEKGHEVEVIIKTKDILEGLLKENNLQYTNILPEGRKNGLINIILSLLKRDLRLFR